MAWPRPASDHLSRFRPRRRRRVGHPPDPDARLRFPRLSNTRFPLMAERYGPGRAIVPVTGTHRRPTNRCHASTESGTHLRSRALRKSRNCRPIAAGPGRVIGASRRNFSPGLSRRPARRSRIGVVPFRDREPEGRPITSSPARRRSGRKRNVGFLVASSVGENPRQHRTCNTMAQWPKTQPRHNRTAEHGNSWFDGLCR